MHIEPPSLQHLGALPPDSDRIDAGLLQPWVLERLARNLPGLAELTLMIDDPAALAGPSLPTVRRLRLVRVDGLAKLWPQLRSAFPGLRALHLVDPVRLTAEDLAPLAADGLDTLGLFDPPADAADALAGWPDPDRFVLRTPDPAPWLARLDPQRLTRLSVYAKAPLAAAVERFAGPVLRQLALHGATDIEPARLLALTALEALSLSGGGPLKGIGRLGALRRLELDGAPGPAAIELAHLRTLERLAVRGSPHFDGGGLTLIAGLPRLEWLDLSDCPALCPNDLMPLQAATRLRALALRGDAVGGGLMHLRGLGLRHLDLRGCALDGGDFAELAAMEPLVRLDVDLLAWQVDREARMALLAAQRAALAHYRYGSRALPDGAVEETVCDAERPWVTRTRVQGVERGD